MLFFDLPVVSEKQKRAYSHFVKAIKRQGFYMLQYSLYIKLNMDERSAASSVKQVKEILPKEGYVAILTVTEKQFASIEYLLGEPDTDVVTTDERVLVI